MIENPKFTYIDLFCGIGGSHLGLEANGGKCLFASDIDEHCQKVYEANFGIKPYGNIRDEKVLEKIPEKFDLLMSTNPCQSFSVNGKQKGFEDTRGTLFFDVFSIIEKHQPKVAFFENVSNLEKHDGGKTMKIIVEALQNLGYNVSYKVLNASNFGLPTERKRIFIVASKKGKFNFDLVEESKEKVTIRQFLNENEEFKYLKKEDYEFYPYDESKIGKGMILCGRRKCVRKSDGKLITSMHQHDRIRSVDGTMATLCAGEQQGRHWIYFPENGGYVRNLTLNECYRIMGFPNGFKKDSTRSYAYKQIGNTVAVPIINEICKQIVEQNLLSD